MPSGDFIKEYDVDLTGTVNYHERIAAAKGVN